jgi:translocation and assembly module TamB
VTKESRRQKIRWLEHVLWVLGTWIALVLALVIIAVGSGLANPLLRRLLIQRMESLTGAKVEIRTVAVGWFSLDATVNGLVIHGTEPKDTEPLASVEQAKIGLRVDSFWGRRVSLKELIVESPRIHVRVEKNGTNNLPTLNRPTKSNEPLQETLLKLHVGHLQIDDGWILYNNVKSLIAVEGADLRLNITLSGTTENPLYLGQLNWDSVEFGRRRDVPVPANLSAKFSLGKQGLAIEQGILDVGRSHLDLQASMPDLEQVAFTYRYRAWLDLLDLREAFQTPEVPLGRIDLRGEGAIGGGKVTGKGSFAGDNVTLGFTDFHSANLISRSSYTLDEKGVTLPDFAGYALGGSVKGRITMKYEGLQFRAETRLQDVRLSQVTPAIDHEGFPIDALHWDSVISADTVETWHDNFRDFDITAALRLDEPSELKEGHIPITGDWKIRYRDSSSRLEIQQLDFETPTSRGTISGVLAPKNTALDVHLEVGSLENWSDFIHALSSDQPGSPEAQQRYVGSLQWDGTITGESGGPTFSGHFRGENFQYSEVKLDALDGDLTYSPTGLKITQGHASRGLMKAGIDGELELHDWEFAPDSHWSSEINLEQVPLEGLEQLGGWNYPLHGLLTGQFRGQGTRSEPALTGNFDLSQGEAYTVPFNRLRGQLNVRPDEVRLSNAELRFFEPGTEKSGAGIVTGNVAYQFADKSLTMELVGASLPLENFSRVKAAGLPIGGQMTFRLKSSGPVTQPIAEGTFRLVDFRIATEVIGSLDGELHSDGNEASFKIKSAMSTGAISGGVTLGLKDPMPVDGNVSINNISLDPYLLSALHLEKFAGHGTADGDITVKGELQHPENIVVDGTFTRLVLTYENVQLENSGPIHLTSTRDSLKILSATLKGANTNVDLSGSVQFTGRRTLAMKMNGSVDLRLLSAYIPGVDVNGHVEMNASVDGPLDRPRIIGQMKVESVSLRSSDFPTGLSNVQGNLVFDANRLFFENVTGEAGGGTLTLSGSVNYSERPLRYDISARTDRLRIRYPEGLSWLLGGQLRLSGTMDGGLLSGKVVVQRVTLNGGLESAGSLVSSGDSSSSSSSSFLRNLQFDVEAGSTPDARMEWPGAMLEAEAKLRVRGTAEHPIMLGHIHVLSGDLYFRDNHYHVTRGDLNFANPFRLDPTINVEATTNIQQYEITLNFTGQSSKLSLSYRSDPPLPANDIVTLLAVGQTGSESTLRSGSGTQTGASGASALLSEAISSQLGGRVERLFGITRFRVDPGLAGIGTTSSNQNAGARITVEQQVTPNLSLMYVSNVSSTQEQVIQVEYNVTRNISVVALRDQNGTFGVDIKFKKRLP